MKPDTARDWAAPLRNRYDALSNREQRLVSLMAAVLVATVVWTLGIEPAIDTLTKGRERLAEQATQASRVMALSAQLLTQKQTAVTRASPQQSTLDTLQTRLVLMNWQDKATAEDKGGGLFQVDVGNVPAADALEWLDTTERLTGLQLQTLTLEKVSTGTVSFKAGWSSKAATGEAGP